MKKLIFLFIISNLCAKEFSVDTLKAMCFRKDSESCNYVANWYMNNVKDNPTALSEGKIYYQLSCKFGNPKGCYKVGVFYQNGYGIMQNKNAAKAYFNVACIGGNSEACFEMGIFNSIGKNMDKEEAIYYFKKSCYFGNKLGCTNYEAIK